MSSSSLVLITGATSGIGEALAHRYATLGHRLALVARREDALQTVLSALPTHPAGHCAYAADVRNAPDMAQVAQRCIERQGLPDIVIANAGISAGVDTAEADDLLILRNIIETNVLGIAHTFSPFLAAMRARASGVLVGISSVAGIRGLPGHGAYCASKAAAITYCESLRGELRGTGVSVVTICPGYVRTPLTEHNGFHMPFLMSAQAFAAQAVPCIAARKSYQVIPWPMAIIARILHILPNAVFDRLAQRLPRKPRARLGGPPG